MLNTGLYYAPDRPYENPANLTRKLKLENSLAFSDVTVKHLAKNIKYVSIRFIQVETDVFGPVCNTNTSNSLAWNLVRTLTFIKECVRVVKISCHVNMGMGVGGIRCIIPLPLTQSSDATRRW